MTVDATPFTRPCRACGRTIAMVRTPDGTSIPLDMVAPVWRIETDLTGEPVAVRDMGARVTHFATCPSANEFSGKGSRKR